MVQGVQSCIFPWLASGKHLHSYGTSLFLMGKSGKSTMSMAIFNSKLSVYQRVTHVLPPFLVNSWLVSIFHGSFMFYNHISTIFLGLRCEPPGNFWSWHLGDGLFSLLDSLWDLLHLGIGVGWRCHRHFEPKKTVPAAVANDVFIVVFYGKIDDKHWCWPHIYHWIWWFGSPRLTPIGIAQPAFSSHPGQDCSCFSKKDFPKLALWAQFLPARWCPPFISWFINPIDYSYEYHKSQLLEL